MTLTNHEQCAQLCALLAHLCKQRNAIEARRAVMERLGLADPDVVADPDIERLDAAIVQAQQLIATLRCDCDNCKDAANDGGASHGLSPFAPAV